MISSIDNIVKINLESSDRLGDILDSYQDQRFNSTSMQFFSLNILRRVVFYQQALNPMLEKLKSNINFELPIAILLRAACLDILQFGYILKKIDDSNEVIAHSADEAGRLYDNIANCLREIYYDNITNQINDWKALKDEQQITVPEFEQRIGQLKDDFKAFYPVNGSKRGKPLGARQIYRFLKKDSKYELFSEVFHHYSHFSKLEHFGILTFAYSIYHKQSLELIFQRVEHIVASLLHISQTGLKFLDAQETDITYYDELINKLLPEK